MEVTIPLLEEYKLEPDIHKSELLQSDEKTGKKKGKRGKSGKGDAKKDKNKSGKGSKNKSSKSGKSAKSNKTNKKGKKAHDSPYSAPDEIANEIKFKIKNYSFKTDRLPWSKVIEFPEDCLRVNVPDNIEKKLTVMRDVFRTLVNVKAVFTQVLPPQKPGKKSKKDKKGKKDNSKSKAKAKDKKKEKGKGKNAGKTKKKDNLSTATAKSEPVPEPEPQETVIKKITLANFNCELHNPNWSAKTNDYYWCKHEQFPPDNAVEVEGSLRNILYTEAKKKKKGKKDKKDKKGDKGKKTTGKKEKPNKKDKKDKKKGKGGKSSKSSKSKGIPENVEEEFVIIRKAPTEDFLPDIFTVQVGFGLNRIPPVKEILNLNPEPDNVPDKLIETS